MSHPGATLSGVFERTSNGRALKPTTRAQTWGACPCRRVVPREQGDTPCIRSFVPAWIRPCVSCGDSTTAAGLDANRGAATG